MGKSGGGARRPSAHVRERATAAARNTTVAPDARATLTRWFGRNLSTSEIRRMVGAPTGASVSVRTEEDRYGIHDGETLRFAMRGPQVKALVYAPNAEGKYELQRGTVPLFGGNESGDRAGRYLTRHADGSLTMHNDSFRVHRDYQGKGVGLRMLATEAKTLSAMGVRDIRAAMAGYFHSSDQGYRIWPLMGYDTRPGALSEYYKSMTGDKSVSRATRAGLRRLGKNMTIQQLYGLGADARQWWREHGAIVEGAFDLRPGSPSMRILRSYVERRGMRWEAL